MKRIATFLFAWSFFSPLYSQAPILVADLTLKIKAKSEEVLYFGFAPGDKVLFSLEMVEGKALKEVEVIEYPENVRYKDYEVRSISQRMIQVPHSGILQFRFANQSRLKGRVCQIVIQRIPAIMESTPFNTAVIWKEIFDTTYVMVTKEIDHGGQEWEAEKTRKVLVSVDTSIQQVLSRTERIHSRTKIQANNETEVCFELPKNQYDPDENNPYHSSELVSWAYTITAGEAGKKWFEEANIKALAKSASSVAVKLGVVSTGYGALAVLAIEGISIFTTPPSGDNIQYETYTLIDEEKKVLDAGNSVASSKRISDYKQGQYCMLLKNDNLVEGVNAEITVIAVVIHKAYTDETYTVTETGPRREKVEVKEARVEVKRVPVMVE